MSSYKLNSTQYTTAGTFTFNVPNGVSWLSVTAIGAGGGGGISQVNGSGGGGGGGQSVSKQHIPVTPGGSISVVVGAGGVSEPLATASLLPFANNVGSVNTGLFPEFSRNGGFGGGDGGGLTTIDSLRVYPGAGGARDGDFGTGGTGGGPRAYTKGSPTIGNQGNRAGTNQGGPGRTDTFPKDANRFFSGGGGGAGSHAGTGARDGGAGSPSTWNAAVAGGANNGTTGGGSGGNTAYGAGASGGSGGGTGSNAVGIGTGAGGGGQATVGNNSGGRGADGYVLLTWFEIS